MTPTRSLPIIFAAILGVAIDILPGAVASDSCLILAAHAQSDRADLGQGLFFRISFPDLFVLG